LEIKSILKRHVFLNLVILGLLFIAVGSASAQDEIPDGPVYVMQLGDTLSSVAYRFGISVNDLIEANNIENPDNVPAGTYLVLPGLDWFSGVLEGEIMPLGESYRSITRRYQMDDVTFARLNDVISPTQVGAGKSIVLVNNGTQDLQAGRKAIPALTSLLELAAASNLNPWMVVAENRLEGTWSAIPGDVLLTPGVGESGPGALPEPITQVSYDGDNLVQGHTAVFRISADGLSLQLGGELMGRQLNFFDTGDGNYVALQGVHAQADPGLYPFSIHGDLPDGSSFNYSQMVNVADGGYGREDLTVEERFLDDTVNAQELAFVESIVAPVTPQKYWSGYFTAPSPYSDVITSNFGTRRSYNGSAYDSFHTGVDFGGGVGVEIYAVASGVVVYTGALEVRGNATIIDHGWGVYTGYWHQSEIKVNVGDKVEQGQVIGLVGGTGRSTGAHLHLELWVGGVQVNPLDWIYNVYP
jgi:murein DD-endopeptidase MepM/ murein hydrolase activator NlpD